MKIGVLIIFSLGLWIALPVSAEVYRYVDDNGVMHYTNDLSTVPENKRMEAVEQNEYFSADSPDNDFAPTAVPDFQQREEADADQKAQAARKRELEKRKAALETEYQHLLEQKQALDNDKGFQSRRNRRKYQNRPYIKALVEKEQTLNARMAEIEAEMNRLEAQP